jgi:hypothetical protein
VIPFMELDACDGRWSGMDLSSEQVADLRVIKLDGVSVDESRPLVTLSDDPGVAGAPDARSPQGFVIMVVV